MVILKYALLELGSIDTPWLDGVYGQKIIDKVIETI